MQLILDGSRRSAGATTAPLHVIERLWSLRAHYPEIDCWFANKVVPGIQTGSRRIFLAERSSFLIAKKEGHERKVCTLWVEPGARKAGIASRLMSDAFQWLDTQYPLMTLPEEKYPEFHSLLQRHDFRATQSLEGYYRPGKVELVYNGWLINQCLRSGSMHRAKPE